MLAAIIANLQNVNPTPPGPKPPVKIDRGGGGQSWPGYDIVDIMGALRSFREIPGEHPVARAARRHDHIGAFLKGTTERNRQQQEAREGAAFLAGAALAQSVAEETIRVKEDTIRVKEDEIAKWALAYDQLNAEMAAQAALVAASTQVPAGRGIYRTRSSSGGIGIGAVMLGVAAGVAIGVALARRGARSAHASK